METGVSGTEWLPGVRLKNSVSLLQYDCEGPGGHSDQSTVCACQGSVHSNCQFFISCYIFFLPHTIKHVFVLHNSYKRLYLFGPQKQVKTLRCNYMGLFFSTFVVKQHTAYLFTQMLLPTPMHTLAEAVDPITLMMWAAVEVSHLCSAVDVAIVRLEYTSALRIIVWIFIKCSRHYSPDLHLKLITTCPHKLPFLVWFCNAHLQPVHEVMFVWLVVKQAMRG